MKYTIGIDIGGTNTLIGLVSSNGEIIKINNFHTFEHSSSDSFIDKLINEIHNIINYVNTNNKSTNLNFINGIGIGAPMANQYTGFIEDAHNLPWKNNINIKDILKSEFNTNVILSNDANAAAIGELVYGKAKNLENFIFITLGTGVGSGIVINKKILLGASAYAGEFGHTIAFRNGRQCNCGRKGCIERYCSANGIIETANELISTNSSESNNSILKNLDHFNTIDIYNAAINGDELAKKVFVITGDILGFQLAQVALITSPSHIFIFGGIANAGDLLLKPIKKAFNNNLINVFKNSVKIELSGLPQANAAILGSAALVNNY